MIAVAITLVAVRNASAGRSAPPALAVPVNGVPEYYVALPGHDAYGFANLSAGVPDAVVGDTFTGKRLATVPAPAVPEHPGLRGRDNAAVRRVRCVPRAGTAR